MRWVKLTFGRRLESIKNPPGFLTAPADFPRLLQKSCDRGEFFSLPLVIHGDIRTTC